MHTQAYAYKQTHKHTHILTITKRDWLTDKQTNKINIPDFLLSTFGQNWSQCSSKMDAFTSHWTNKEREAFLSHPNPHTQNQINISFMSVNTIHWLLIRTPRAVASVSPLVWIRPLSSQYKRDNNIICFLRVWDAAFSLIDSFFFQIVSTSWLFLNNVSFVRCICLSCSVFRPRIIKIIDICQDGKFVEKKELYVPEHHYPR